MPYIPSGARGAAPLARAVVPEVSAQPKRAGRSSTPRSGGQRRKAQGGIADSTAPRSSLLARHLAPRAKETARPLARSPAESRSRCGAVGAFSLLVRASAHPHSIDHVSIRPPHVWYAHVRVPNHCRGRARPTLDNRHSTTASSAWRVSARDPSTRRRDRASGYARWRPQTRSRSGPRASPAAGNTYNMLVHVADVSRTYM